MPRHANALCRCGHEHFDHHGGRCSKCDCTSYRPRGKRRGAPVLEAAGIDQHRMAAIQLQSEISDAVKRFLAATEPGAPSLKQPSKKKTSFDSVDDIKLTLTKGTVNGAGVNTTPTLNKCARTIMDVLAVRGPLDTTQLGVATVYSHTSGGFNNALGMLRRAGYISPAGETPGLTPEGRQKHTPGGQVYRGRTLLEQWWNQKKLIRGVCGQAVLNALFTAAHPVDAEWLGKYTNYSPTSGGFNNTLGRLRKLGLIEGYGKQIKINPIFKEDFR